eukprot:m.29781 g.29781  ORF g.29781 m.29781 type:complete len:354 (-) comp12153_c0_seq1:441-1502(-)
MASETTLTSRVLAGVELTPLLLIADSMRCRGLALLQWHAARVLGDGVDVGSNRMGAAAPPSARKHPHHPPSVVALLFETDVGTFLAGIPGAARSPGGLRCVAMPPRSERGVATSEPAGGGGGRDGATDGCADSNQSGYAGVPRKCLRLAVERERKHLSHPPVLLIDTAAMFIMDNSVSVLCRELRGLVDDGVVSSIVVTVHRDIAGVATMAALRDVCSGCLELRTEEGSAGRRRVRSKLHLLKSSGKIIVEECQLSIADHTVLVGQSTTVSDSTTAAADERPDTSTATVMYEGASAEQKQKPRAADAATTRPYTLTEAEQQGILDGGGGGRIFYQPDDGDDFDDEDPDDDLDI